MSKFAPNKPVNFDEVAESWIPAQEYINLNNKINFLKTHSALGTYKNFPFTNKENTLGAIYLVRDPRDVLISYSKYLKGIDMYEDEKGKIVEVPEDRRIYKILWLRTLEIAFFVTLFCFLMAYPIAHLLATLPMKYSNLLMICVLLPFWTSLLVRTASWMILLQQQGLVNDFLVWIGIVADDNRPVMMYNKIGTYIAMTQILLPFMVLPLYSVMKTISPSLMRAGKSLGGTPFIAFWKVYFPLTIPGIGAGCLLVFILAIGYYITPALVGGASGTLISNQIAFHMKSTLDWSFASAMGLMLLTGVLAIYWVYNKLVGVDNIKLG